MNNIMGKMTSIGATGIGNITIANIAYSIFILLICLIAVKIIMEIIGRAIKRANIAEGLHKFIKSVCKILLYFIVIIIVADSLGIPITSLIAVLSVVGLAISLSIQGALSNLANGIMILITKPFCTGDAIDVAGESGTVAEIQLIYTKLITADNNIVYIPNTQIANGKVTNYTREGKRRTEIKVGVSYESKTEDVKKAIGQAIEKCSDLLLKDSEIFIKISDYKESYIEYTVKVWAETDKFWDAYFAVLEDIKVEFDNNNIKMPYNHLNVHMMGKI